jgi:transglutaminase-like putative cysteine protease
MSLLMDRVDAPASRRANEPRPGRRLGRGLGRCAADQAAALLLAVAAGLPLLRVFGSPGLTLLLMAAVPASVIAGGAQLASSRSRSGSSWLRPLSLLLAALAGTVPGMLLAAADPYEPASLPTRFADALTDGWHVLLSVPLPVPDTRSFVGLPLLLIAVATTVIALTAAGPRPAGALIPATGVFGLLLVFGVHGPVPGSLLSGAFVVAALVYLVTTTRAQPLRIRAVAVLGALGVMAATVLVWTAAPSSNPYDPRTALVPPSTSTNYADPLAQLSFDTSHPGVPVFSATLSGALAAHPRNWVVLAYDDYDGGRWTSATSARPGAVSETAPDALGTGSASVQLRQSSELLPHPPYLTTDTPNALDYDPGHELLLTTEPGLRDYVVDDSVSEPSAQALNTAAVPANAAADLLTVPTCAPAGIKTLATRAEQTAGLPDEQAVALERDLQAKPYVYDPSSAPGESCGSVDRLLTGGRGTSSQFATAFAMAARILGLPTRVVFGYLPGTVSAGSDTVTDGDAYCWPQVLFTGVGWVDFDPTPQAGTVAAQIPREQQQGITKLSRNLSSGKISAPGNNVLRVPVPAHHSSAVWIITAVLVVPAMILLWLTAVRARLVLLRRKRRRAGDPAAQQVLGAWEELLDPLHLAGVGLRGKTAPKIAVAAAEVAPGAGSQAGRLASLVESALYYTVSDDEVSLAWDLSDQARRSVLRSLRPKARLRRLVKWQATRRMSGS